MISPRQVLFVCTLVLFLSACRQDADDLPPSVTITAPSSNLPDYAFGEDLYAAFSCTDGVELSQWTYRLTDESGTLRASNGYQTIGGEALSFEANFVQPLEDVQWPSGDYTLAVFVRDAAGNEGAAFKTIRYYEAPLERTAVFLLREVTGQIVIDSLDTTTNDFTEAYSTSGNISCATTGNIEQEVVIGGRTQAQLWFSPHPDLGQFTSYLGQNPLQDVFVRDLYRDTSNLRYVAALADGNIREFEQGGSLVNTIAVNELFLPEQVAVTNEHCVSSLRSVGQNNRNLAIYFRNTGTLINSYTLQGDVVAIEGFTSDRLIAFINKDDGTVDALRYDPATQTLVGTGWLVSNSPLRTALHLGDGRYAVAHDEGVAFHNFVQGTFQPAAINSIAANDLAYDPVSGSVFAIDANSVVQLNPNSGMLMQQWMVGQGPKAIEVLLNK